MNKLEKTEKDSFVTPSSSGTTTEVWRVGATKVKTAGGKLYIVRCKMAGKH